MGLRLPASFSRTATLAKGALMEHVREIPVRIGREDFSENGPVPVPMGGTILGVGLSVPDGKPCAFVKCGKLQRDTSFAALVAYSSMSQTDQHCRYIGSVLYMGSNWHVFERLA